MVFRRRRSRVRMLSMFRSGVGSGCRVVRSFGSRFRCQPMALLPASRSASQRGWRGSALGIGSPPLYLWAWWFVSCWSLPRGIGNRSTYTDAARAVSGIRSRFKPCLPQGFDFSLVAG